MIGLEGITSFVMLASTTHFVSSTAELSLTSPPLPPSPCLTPRVPQLPLRPPLLLDYSLQRANPPLHLLYRRLDVPEALGGGVDRRTALRVRVGVLGVAQLRADGGEQGGADRGEESKPGHRVGEGLYHLGGVV